GRGGGRGRGRQGRRQWVGGQDSVHSLNSPRHELLDGIGDRSRTLHNAGYGLHRLMETGHSASQSLQPLPLLSCELNDEGLWVGCTIASRTPAAALGGPAPQQSPRAAQAVAPAYPRAPAGGQPVAGPASGT